MMSTEPPVTDAVEHEEAFISVVVGVPGVLTRK
jgi:hypothetical protein